MTEVKAISLETAHTALGWASPDEVMHPTGAGADIFAALVRDKIGRTLARFDDAGQARIGVLMANSKAIETDPPLAIVVDFPRDVSEVTLRELHRLAWNFSHSPTLITLEPGLLRVWTCCEPPDADRLFDDFVVHRVAPSELAAAKTAENRAARALHWINLASGEFFSQHADRFHRDGRADQMLLGNLRHIRAKLAGEGFDDDDICHDLLARVIFVQFLFDRKDADGVPALTPLKLARLHAEGVLNQLHDSFHSILSNYHDTYKLFDWLNTRFNGDLFPGKGETAVDRAQGWAKEKRVVTKRHLALLADFIQGKVDMPSGQRCLWPQYSFDVIPLEFISSIYETFVTKRAAQNGIFYTPPHLVDFVLDQVLPWDGMEWDVKILDPACGSGIFLVKAFQRLVHRWKRANPNQPLRAELLRRLLERNIFGADIDPHAVRVACFSLYLAMCDEIEPRHYWTQVVFPAMREKRLICADFFAEGVAGFDSTTNAGTYDFVVGNAPWGEDLVTQPALEWAATNEHKWTVANKDLGGLFLAKSALLLKAAGRIAMIQSANALLFNGARKAVAFRRELFTRHRVETIYNLSALRFDVFKRKSHTTKKPISPTCVIVISTAKPSPEDRIAYTSPKRLKPLVDEFAILIEPCDRRFLTVREALSDPCIWTTLMWGGSRDRALLKKLQTFPNLTTRANGYEVKTRQGVIYGDRQRSEPQLHDRPLFSGKSFPADSLLYLNTDGLPDAGPMRVHSRDSTDFSAFAWPQLIIKKGWQKASSRFQARLAQSKRREPAIFNDSYVSVHASQALLEAACVSLNSIVAIYFLQLMSGRIAAYRPAALVNELLTIPVPQPQPGLIDDLTDYKALDARVFDAFGLKDSERVLVEDLFNYTVADFRGQDETALPTGLSPGELAPDVTHLQSYCQYFIRVLLAGFGGDKVVKATIFEPDHDEPLPYRMVGFALGGVKATVIDVANVHTQELLAELERLDIVPGKNGATRRGIYSERVVRIYDGSAGVPMIFVIKPNAARHWTRSVGLSDGDEVALDLFRWHLESPKDEVHQ